MKANKILVIASIIITTLLSCKTPQNNMGNVSGNTKAGITGPAAIIYKTKADYSTNVPVTLSDDKSQIVSYPAPQDIYFNGTLAYPTKLAKGFLLDNRGIGVNTAFIKLTYEEYAKLSAAPSTDELYKMIIDKNPITEMYNLGSRKRFANAPDEINTLIEKHQLKQFKRLK